MSRLRSKYRYKLIVQIGLPGHRPYIFDRYVPKRGVGGVRGGPNSGVGGERRPVWHYGSLSFLFLFSLIGIR